MPQASSSAGIRFMGIDPGNAKDARRRSGRSRALATELQLQQVGTRSRVSLALLSFVLPVTLSVVLPLFWQQSTTASHWISGTTQAHRAWDQWLGPMLVAAVAAAVWLVTDRLMRRHE